MNEQIKQILDTPEFERLRDWASIGPVQKATLESFVELVVQESIDVIVRHDYHGQWLGEKIKQHFGIDQ